MLFFILNPVFSISRVYYLGLLANSCAAAKNSSISVFSSPLVVLMRIGAKYNDPTLVFPISTPVALSASNTPPTYAILSFKSCLRTLPSLVIFLEESVLSLQFQDSC